MNKHLLTMLFTATLLTPLTSTAQTMHHDMSHMNHMNHMSMDHNGHHMGVDITPSNVTGTHLHKKGDFMLSYKFMQMGMDGNRNGTDDISSTQVMSFSNPNSPPANFRVVPTAMTMNMHMIGGMVGITDRINGMVMVNYLDNDMDHTTYNMGGTKIGNFTTQSSGFGDTEIAGIFSIIKNDRSSLNAQLGLSLPTGSIDEEDEVLSPMNTRPTLRLPYAMQLGSGTYDLKPGLTYTYKNNDWSYGTSYKGRIHIGENDEDYTRGDWHELTAWAGHEFSDKFGISGGIHVKTEGKIDGSDAKITAPVQTADPDNYGGEKIDLSLNMGWKFYKDNTLKAGLSAPIYQDLNGPQLKDTYSLNVKWQKSF